MPDQLKELDFTQVPAAPVAPADLSSKLVQEERLKSEQDLRSLASRLDNVKKGNVQDPAFTLPSFLQTGHVKDSNDLKEMAGWFADAAKTAVDAESFGSSVLVGGAKNYVSELFTDTAVDSKFTATLQERIKADAPNVSFSHARDYLLTAPNEGVYRKRLAYVNQLEAAREELSVNPAARGVAAYGNFADAAVSALPGLGAGKLASSVGVTNMAGRFGIAGAVNVASGGALDILNADGGFVNTSDLFGNAALNFVLGGAGDGLNRADFMRAGDFLKGTAGRLTNKGIKPVLTVTEDGVHVIKGASTESKVVAQAPEVLGEEHGLFKAGQKQALAGNVEQVPHPDFVDVAARDSFKSYVKQTLDDALTELGKSTPDAVQDTFKSADMEAYVEAHLGVDLPDGWLTKGTASELSEHVLDYAERLQLTQKAQAGDTAAVALLESLPKPRAIEARVADVVNEAAPPVETVADFKALTDSIGVKVSHGKRSYDLQFDNPLDKALYLVGQDTKIAADDRLMTALRSEFPHLNDAAIRTTGKHLADNGVANVLDEISSKARPGESVKTRLPGMVRQADLSDKPGSVVQVEAQVSKAFGPVAKKLLKDGTLRVVNNTSEIPGLPKDVNPKAVAGVFVNGKGYLVASNLNPKDVEGVMLHEIAVHGGLRQMLGEVPFQKVLADVATQADAGDAAFVKARKLAQDAVATGMSRTEDLAEETLAYLVQHAPEHGFVAELVSKVKQWVYQLTNGRVNWLNDADYRSLAVSALKSVSKRDRPLFAIQQATTDQARIEWGAPGQVTRTIKDKHGEEYTLRITSSGQFPGYQLLSKDGEQAAWGHITASGWTEALRDGVNLPPKFMERPISVHPNTEDDFLRRGLHSAVVAAVEDVFQRGVVASDSLSEDAEAFWKSYRNTQKARWNQEIKDFQESSIAKFSLVTKDEPLFSKVQQATEEALKEWKDGGYKEAGYLTPDAATPSGAVFVPATNKVAMSHLSLKVPKTSKGIDLRVGFAPADYVGTSASNTTRAMGDLLFVNAVGKAAQDGKGFLGTNLGRGSELVPETADTLSDLWKKTSMGEVQAISNKVFVEWMETNGIKPSNRQDFQFETARRFDRELCDALRGVPGVSEATRKGAAEIQKVVAKFHAEVKALAQRVGAEATDSQLKKAADIEVSDKYLSRKWDKEGRLNLYARAGEEQAQKVFVEALRGANPEMTEEALNTAARELMDNLDKLDDTMSMTLAEFLPESADRVPRQLVERIALDELHAPVVLTMKDGTQEAVTIRDLFVNSSDRLVGSWFNTMAGVRALGHVSERVGVDLTHQGAWNDLMKQMRREGATDKEIRLINEGRNHIRGQVTGLWQSESELGSAVRKMLTMRYGMYFAFAQLADLGNQVPQAQVKRLVDSMPGIGDIKRMAKNGGDPQGLARDYASAIGLGYEHLTPMLKHSVESGNAGKAYDAIGMALHKTMSLNGFYTMVDAVKHMAVNFQAYKLADAAHGRYVIDESNWKHLNVYGMSKERFEALKPLLQKHVKFDANNVMERIDFEAMRKEDPRLTTQFEVFLHKVRQDAGSESAGIGQQIPFFTGEFGRFIWQFQNAAMVSHQRLRRDLLNFDWNTAGRWIVSYLMSAASYYARTYVATIGREDEREQKLNADTVFRAAVRNTSSAGFIPNVIEAGAGVTPWDNPLQTSTVSGRVSANLPPVFDAIQSGRQAIKDLTSAAFSDDDVLTKGEAHKASRVVNPLLAVQIPLQILTKELPSQNLPKSED